jgi:hypothetical protein
VNQLAYRISIEHMQSQFFLGTGCCVYDNAYTAFYRGNIALSNRPANLAGTFIGRLAIKLSGTSTPCNSEKNAAHVFAPSRVDNSFAMRVL